MLFTEARPTFTGTRTAVLPSAPSLNRLIVLFSFPNAGRPTNSTSVIRSRSIVPSTLRSGRAPSGSAPASLYVNRHRSVHYRRIDSHHLALDHAVMRVDLRRLANLDVPRLRLRDLQAGLQLVRLHHLRQRRSWSHVLANLMRRVRPALR